MKAIVLVILLLVSALPAFAEHKTYDCDNDVPHGAVASSGPARASVAPESQDLDIELKVGRDHFRLGGRLVGPGGGAGAWLNGQRRPWGFSLDGRVQNDARRGFNFTLDADVRDWLPWATRAWVLGVPFRDTE